jgi:hypothetical protein
MAFKIGIALAAYQPDLKFFVAQLQSIQAQTWTDWECWVSSDSRLDTAHQEFKPFLADHRFHWSENPSPLGHRLNFQKAIQSVLALNVDAIACCDQDDVWYPRKLEVSIAQLEAMGPNALVFCDMNLMDAQGVRSSETAWKVERRGVHHISTFDLLVRNVVPGTGMLMRAELARKFPQIPEAAIFHDHWYPLIASVTGRLKPIYEPLYAYRLHGDNVVGVEPFEGVFKFKSQSNGFRGVIQKCKEVWSRSHRLATALEASNLKLTFFQRLCFAKSWDLGAGLFFYGLSVFFTDPALTRACWARAAGKLFYVVGLK